MTVCLQEYHQELVCCACDFNACFGSWEYVKDQHYAGRGPHGMESLMMLKGISFLPFNTSGNSV